MCYFSLALQRVYGCRYERSENGNRMGFRFLDEERGWSLPGLLIAYDLVLCGELEEDLKVMMAHFVEVCGRRCLKVNTDKRVVQ